MHHVAIMNKSWGLILKILARTKTIESRWYQTRRAPWNKASVGDTVFFKNAGQPVTAKAKVSEVMQFEIDNLEEARDIAEKYGHEIGLLNSDPETWERLPKYCVLLSLEDPAEVSPPFQINKTGFGNGSAWLTVEDIKQITLV